MMIGHDDGECLAVYNIGYIIYGGYIAIMMDVCIMFECCKQHLLFLE